MNQRLNYRGPRRRTEKAMATHSSALAQSIPGTVEPGGLPSMGSHRVGHDLSDLEAAAEKKKGYEKSFEEIIVENFLNMEKEIVNQVQKAQRVPYRINPRRNMPRHILIKLTKTTQRKNVESSKGKATSNIQGKPHTLNS